LENGLIILTNQSIFFFDAGDTPIAFGMIRAGAKEKRQIIVWALK
jgi:hypothetical protein